MGCAPGKRQKRAKSSFENREVVGRRLRLLGNQASGMDWEEQEMKLHRN